MNIEFSRINILKDFRSFFGGSKNSESSAPPQNPPVTDQVNISHRPTLTESQVASSIKNFLDGYNFPNMFASFISNGHFASDLQAEISRTFPEEVPETISSYQPKSPDGAFSFIQRRKVGGQSLLGYTVSAPKEFGNSRIFVPIKDLNADGPLKSMTEVIELKPDGEEVIHKLAAPINDGPVAHLVSDYYTELLKRLSFQSFTSMSDYLGGKPGLENNFVISSEASLSGNSFNSDLSHPLFTKIQNAIDDNSAQYVTNEPLTLHSKLGERNYSGYKITFNNSDGKMEEVFVPVLGPGLNKFLSNGWIDFTNSSTPISDSDSFYESVVNLNPGSVALVKTASSQTFDMRVNIERSLEIPTEQNV